MSFLRHVGKISDRKVAIVFREVPGEDHMALVVYTESLNRHVHDPLMKCIESDIGQNSENLADALNRTHTNDGKIILQVLHKEGLLKKVQTNQVVMTPSPTTQIKLDELNKMLDEMKQGEEAVARLAELDQSLGMQTAKQVANRAKNKEAAKTAPPVNIPDSARPLAPIEKGIEILANDLPPKIPTGTVVFPLQKRQPGSSPNPDRQGSRHTGQFIRRGVGVTPFSNLPPRLATLDREHRIRRSLAFTKVNADDIAAGLIQPPADQVRP